MVAFEIGAADDVGVMLGEPGSEHAQALLDVADGGGSQAEADLFDVAQRVVPVAGGDLFPAGHAHWRLHDSAGEGVDLVVVEQGELQPMEDRPHVAAGLGVASPCVGVVDLGAGCEEPFGVDLVGSCPGQRGDLAERVPLQRRVLVGRGDSAGGVDEPGVHVGEVLAGGAPETKIGQRQEVGAGRQPSGDQQP